MVASSFVDMDLFTFELANCCSSAKNVSFVVVVKPFTPLIELSFNGIGPMPQIQMNSLQEAVIYYYFAKDFRMR